jgi:hypothetical protein
MKTKFFLIPVVFVLGVCVAGAQTGVTGVSGEPRGFQFFGSPPPADFSAGLEGPDDSGGGFPLDLGFFSRKPFVITFSVRQGYDSNVFTTKDDPDDSWYTNWAAGISYQFGTPRLQFNASVGGGLTYYYTRPGDKTDFNGALTFALTYEATPRLTITANTTTAFLSQPDLTLVGGTNRSDGDYFYTNTSIAAGYQWTEKFSTTTAYRFGAYYYLEDNLNDTQGRMDQTISQSFNYQILPRTIGLVEYRANPVTYYEADLDSFGQFFLLGIDQVLNPRLSWSGRVGAELRFLNNPVDGKSNYLGPYFESNLSYQFGPASSIGWLMRYGTEASGLTNVTQRQTFRTGINIVHGFTPRISGNLGVTYIVNYYDQRDVIPSFYENIVQASVGLNFAVNRFVSLSAGYQFTIDVAPDAPEREYNRSVVFAGANFTF